MRNRRRTGTAAARGHRRGEHQAEHRNQNHLARQQMRSHDAPPQSVGCAEGCHRPPQHPASGAGRSVSACTFVHARSASAHGWPVTVEPTSLGWLVLRDDGVPRAPIRPERAAADRQACRSLQDRHCRGELARTQLPSQAGDVLKALQREASRNVQGRRYVSIRRCAYVPAVTTDKEPVHQLSDHWQPLHGRGLRRTSITRVSLKGRPTGMDLESTP